MRTLVQSVRDFLKREDGPTAVEYAVMLALIIVVCIVGIMAQKDTFITIMQLLPAIRSKVKNNVQTLGILLIQQGTITAEHVVYLEGLAAAHLHRHQNDAHKRLAALAVVYTARDELAKS